jgi:hypothetical protein
MIKIDKPISIDIIEILWDGPYKIQGSDKFKRNSDYGIYQIYGTHNIYGAETLLYIGKAESRTFSSRFAEHKEWVEWEPTPVDIYLGRLGGIDKTLKGNLWEDQIDRAERLLIYYCSPPYNSKGLNEYGKMPSTVVLNYGKRKHLPYEFSNLDERTSFWQKDSKWKLYGE